MQEANEYLDECEVGKQGDDGIGKVRTEVQLGTGQQGSVGAPSTTGFKQEDEVEDTGSTDEGMDGGGAEAVRLRLRRIVTKEERARRKQRRHERRAGPYERQRGGGGQAMQGKQGAEGKQEAATVAGAQVEQAAREESEVEGGDGGRKRAASSEDEGELRLRRRGRRKGAQLDVSEDEGEPRLRRSGKRKPVQQLVSSEDEVGLEDIGTEVEVGWQGNWYVGTLVGEAEGEQRAISRWRVQCEVDRANTGTYGKVRRRRVGSRAVTKQTATTAECEGRGRTWRLRKIKAKEDEKADETDTGKTETPEGTGQAEVTYRGDNSGTRTPRQEQMDVGALIVDPG